MTLEVDWLGHVDYVPTYAAMQRLTQGRTPESPDLLWVCEHAPVYTQGLAGKADHVLNPGEIPVVQTDRGGQVTYHGPGQVVAYPLVNLRRLRVYVKEYVYRLEQAALDVLSSYGLTGHRVSGTPGVFVRLDEPSGHRRLPAAPGADDRFAGLGKVAALGIKVSNQCAYHGLACNVAMNLEPFSRINPCGFAGLATVDLATLGVHTSWDDVSKRLGARLSVLLSA